MKLELSYPLDKVVINQGFGDNPQFYSDPKYGGIKGHNGIDFFAVMFTPVYATHDGLASFQIDNSGGHGIVIVTDKEYESSDGRSSYWKTIYWHLVDGLKYPQYQSPIADKTGFTPVKNGDLIGYADNTGASTGSHLHFGLKPVDKGEDWGTWMNLSQNNGFAGAEDPTPYFDGFTPVKIENLKKQVDLLTQLVNLLKKLFN